MALILIVDDESPHRHDVKKVLANEGYRIISITDPTATWAYINRLEPDLVLLNGLSEQFQSFEILNDIKQRSPEFPVLVYMVKDNDAVKKLKQAVALALFEVRFSRREKRSPFIGSVRSGQVQNSF
ncbi:response regulator [Desulfococcus sp.]|uniref:response regulator n=1 Tax=Desulfococcus sp. TaxID=2025834 RepID=UPI003594341A